MDEVRGRDATWTFDLEYLRIAPGHGRGVHKLRQAIGELSVPVEAIAGTSYEPGRKGGRLRLRLREGADPLTQATGGLLGDSADPYLLAVDTGQTGTGQYFVEAVRTALLVQQVSQDPVPGYLLPAPSVPISATAGDGTATFDGEFVRLDWGWMAKEGKQEAGPVQLALSDVTSVEWRPQSGFGYGYLRFQTRGVTTLPAPEHDRNSLAWGVQREGGTTALVAAAVVSRLPHPVGGPAALPVPGSRDLNSTGVNPPGPNSPGPNSRGPNSPGADDPDAMLRRLRELGELHKSGILTDGEFTAAKQKLLGL